MKEKLINHLNGSDILDDADIEFLLNKYKEWRYSGTAYRVLIFFKAYEYNDFVLKSVQFDKSFSKTEQGISYFISTKDLNGDAFSSFEPKIILIKCNCYGIDVEKVRKDIPNLPQYTCYEEEIIPLEVSDLEIVYNGDAKDFYL